MELAKEILSKILAKEEFVVTFPSLNVSLTEIVEGECYKALLEIKGFISDDRLSDFDCVEKIVCLLEDMGSGGGGRHDFG